MSENPDQSKVGDVGHKAARRSLVIAVTGAAHAQSKFEVASGRSVRVDLPETFTADHVSLATRDAEILAGILKENSYEYCQIVNAVATGDFEKAKKMAEQIGLTEANVVRQGGGMWALIIGIAVGCALLCAHD
jgi:hypothetical protein